MFRSCHADRNRSRGGDCLSIESRYVNVQGRLLKFSNLSKVFYPASGFTKGQILEYYRKIGPTVLPYLQNRPFTLKRFPDGVRGSAFYEKQCPHYRQPWVATGIMGSTRYCLINDLATLLWAVNLAAIELHTTLGTISSPQKPTMCVFDLDPGEGVDLSGCMEVALQMQNIFKTLRLEAVPKTSGMKGLHLLVPLNSQQAIGSVREFTKQAAEFMELKFPDLVTSKMPKQYRAGKVYIDWQQNTDFKTTTSVYSLGANEFPTVSTPLDWREIEPGTARNYEVAEVLERVRKKGDLAAPVLETVQTLPVFNDDLRGILGRALEKKSKNAA